MNLTDDDKLRLLLGKPLVYKDICLIYSPIMGKIATTGLSEFYNYLSLLLISKPPAENQESKKLLDSISDFEYLLMLVTMEPERKKTLARAIEFFTEDRATLLPDKTIVLGDLTEKRILDKNNFYDFQSYIGAACAMEDYTSQRIEFLDSDTPQVRALKIQMIEGQKKRKAAKEKESKKKGSDIQFADLVASIPIGTSGSYSLADISNMTYYAFQDQLKRMGWYEEFNINTRAAMAGAKIDKKNLSHWIKSMTFK